jgi:hypothetical protein
MKKLMFVILGASFLSAGFIAGTYAQRRSTRPPETSTFLQSQAAIIKLGVWEKFGTPRNYTATFLVTGPNGKEYNASKRVRDDDSWVYTEFPEEFHGGIPSYSTLGNYDWKCVVDGRVVAHGRFQWGGSRAIAN